MQLGSLRVRKTTEEREREEKPEVFKVQSWLSYVLLLKKEEGKHDGSVVTRSNSACGYNSVLMKNSVCV